MFAIYVDQGARGCDYTIDCAKKLIFLPKEITSEEKAKEWLHNWLSENYTYEEGRFETVQILNIRSIVDFNIYHFYKDWDAEQKKMEDQATEEQERMTYLELHNKYGPTNKV